MIKILNIIILLTFVLNSNDIRSQVYLQWSKKYEYQHGYGRNIGFGIQIDNFSNIYVAGASSAVFGGSRLDLILIKYTVDGNLIWINRFADTITPFPNNSNGGGPIVLHSDNVFVAGSRFWDYDTSGSLIWNYQPPGGKGFSNLFITKDLNFLTAGEFANSSYLIRGFTYEGNLDWERIYKPTGTIFARYADARKDLQDNIISTGYMNKPGLGSYYDWVTVKYSSNGDLLWAQRYDKGEDNLCYAMTVDDSNNVYVTGSARFPNVKDMLTIKYSPEGVVLWEKYFDGGFGGDTGYDVEVDKYGNVYVLGKSVGLGLTLSKYDASGNTLWVRSRPDNVIGNLPILRLDKDQFAYTGFKITLSSGKEKLAFEKYDPNGNLKWTAYNSDSATYTNVFDFLVDSSYNLYATGTHADQVITLKFVQTPTLINTSLNEIPSEYKLEQNYPNPFNPVTTIDFQLPKDVNVKIKVYDVSGKEIKTLIDEFKQAGSYNISFDGSNLSSGVYFYRIEAGDFVQTKRMVLLK